MWRESLEARSLQESLQEEVKYRTSPTREILSTCWHTVIIVIELHGHHDIIREGLEGLSQHNNGANKRERGIKRGGADSITIPKQLDSGSLGLSLSISTSNLCVIPTTSYYIHTHNIILYTVEPLNTRLGVSEIPVHISVVYNSNT